MDARIGEQVHHHLMDARGIAENEDLLVGHGHAPVVIGARRVGIAHSVTHNPAEVDSFALQLAPLVEAGKQKEIFYKAGHALGLRLNAIQ